MGSKCKGIMGTVVLRTSCLLQNECVISQFVFTLKKACILFYSSYPYYTLVHDRIWISYFISPGMPFYAEAAQEHTSICYLSSVFILLSVQTKRVPIITRYIPLFFFLHLKSYSITWHTFGMLSDMQIVFFIAPELCKPSLFGLP